MTLQGNQVGAFIYDTSHLDITDCQITGNGTGVFLGAGTSQVRLEWNVVCDNTVLDIEDQADNGGDSNRCAAVSGWSDDGQTGVCDWHCSGCRHPEDDLYVGQDLTLCPGTYAIDDADADGVIRTATSGLTVDGAGAVLIGAGTGIGVRCDHDDTVLKNLQLEGYNFGIRLSQADGCSLSQCSAVGCAANGIFLTSADDNVVTGSQAAGNGSYGYSVASSSGNEFAGCDAVGNGAGYYLSAATGTTVREAAIEGNEYGASLLNATGNLFWNNAFTGNVMNAHENDGSVGNDWNAAVGNLWDDFAGNEGFPDHYVIPGPGDGVDWHPLGEVAVVAPDGTGDYPTIQAAINAADENGIIVLTSGVFSGPGNRDLDCLGKTLWIRSAANDPDSCRIECGGSVAEPHRGFQFVSGESPGTILQGVTITGGYGEGGAGGAMVFTGAAAPTIINCDFETNVASVGGAVCCEGGSPAFEDCRFEGNDATAEGGALRLGSGSQVTLIRTTLDANAAGGQGGAIFITGGSVATLASCTLHASSAAVGGGLYVAGDGGGAELEHTIVGFGLEGAAIEVAPGGSAQLACCDLYGNAGGDWVGAIADQYETAGNISADPAYCDAPAGDFTLQEGSPCAPFSPPNPECDQIGAWPVGCSGVANSPEPRGVPSRIFLGPCRPNPLHAGSALIRFGLPAAEAPHSVSLKVYDAAGHRVRTLVGGPRSAGYHRARWYGDDDDGRPLAGGLYFYRLTAGETSLSRRLVLIR